MMLEEVWRADAEALLEGTTAELDRLTMAACCIATDDEAAVLLLDCWDSTLLELAIIEAARTLDEEEGADDTDILLDDEVVEDDTRLLEVD